mmetsp:Transcript_5574/g.23636  ORF Transcript_5574/g.23636 Transcript_5574/m.23636 type:complete len:200 (+) Transcript_5574:554-1153(+)
MAAGAGTGLLRLRVHAHSRRTRPRPRRPVDSCRSRGGVGGSGVPALGWRLGRAVAVHDWLAADGAHRVHGPPLLAAGIAHDVAAVRLPQLLALGEVHEANGAGCLQELAVLDALLPVDCRGHALQLLRLGAPSGRRGLGHLKVAKEPPVERGAADCEGDEHDENHQRHEQPQERHADHGHAQVEQLRGQRLAVVGSHDP